MYKITIKSAKFFCSIGITPEERKKKQEIMIDVELFLNTKKTAKPFFLSDDIKHTINYSEVHNSLKNIAENKEYNLIEALAENIAKEILNKFKIDKILVSVKKPKALANRNVEYVAVEIIRKNHLR